MTSLPRPGNCDGTRLTGMPQVSQGGTLPGWPSTGWSSPSLSEGRRGCGSSCCGRAPRRPSRPPAGVAASASAPQQAPLTVRWQVRDPADPEAAGPAEDPLAGGWLTIGTSATLRLPLQAVGTEL